MPATDVLTEMGGELAPLSIRIAPELKALMGAFRKETGKRPSEQVTAALTEYFNGYTPAVPSLEEDI
jgi:hypothetical protein